MYTIGNIHCVLAPARQAVLALCVGIGWTAPAWGDAPDLQDRARIYAGKVRFDKGCVACHGSQGQGGKGPSLRARGDLPPDLVYKRITEGKHGPAGDMPPLGAELTPDQVWELVAYATRLGGLPAKPARDELVTPFDLADPERIEAGRKRFAKLCAGYCHGHEGVGGRAPDFKGRSDLPAQFVHDTIVTGRTGADVMPPWGGALSEQQIWELTAYIRHLGTQPAP